MVDKIQADLKQAQLSRDEIKVSTLRLLLSEIKNSEIARGNPLSDEDIVTVVQKEIKKRKESSTAFRNGGREEQAQKEEAESQILEGYLPTQLSNEELTNVIETTINEVGASGMQDMGKVIGAVMDKVKGRSDGGAVSNMVKMKLS